MYVSFFICRFDDFWRRITRLSHNSCHWLYENQVPSSMRLITPSDILMIRVLALYQNGKVPQVTRHSLTHAFYSDKGLKIFLCTLLVAEAVGKIVMISTIVPEEHGTRISFSGFFPHLMRWLQLLFNSSLQMRTFATPTFCLKSAWYSPIGM